MLQASALRMGFLFSSEEGGGLKGTLDGVPTRKNEGCLGVPVSLPNRGFGFH